MNAMEQIERANLSVCFKGEAHGWHLCSDSNGRLHAISVDGNTKGNSAFGDKQHIRRLMSKGYFNRELESITEQGLQYLNGLNSRLMTDSRGKKWSFLGFAN